MDPLGEGLGKGLEERHELSTHAWPGFNRLLAVALDDPKAQRLWEELSELCTRPQGGVRAFLLPLEGMM